MHENLDFLFSALEDWSGDVVERGVAAAGRRERARDETPSFMGGITRIRLMRGPAGEEPARALARAAAEGEGGDAMVSPPPPSDARASTLRVRIPRGLRSAPPPPHGTSSGSAARGAPPPAGATAAAPPPQPQEAWDARDADEAALAALIRLGAGVTRAPSPAPDAPRSPPPPAPPPPQSSSPPSPLDAARCAS
jgi:hypothetical protein